MKSAGTFLIVFGATLLLLFAQAWSENLLVFAWLALVAILLLGGFVWLFLHVVLETLSQFKTTRAKFTTLAALLALFAVTAVLSVFYVWTFIVAFVLFCCLVWRGMGDFADIFRHRQSQPGPENWRALERGQLPAMSASAHKHAKERFAHSHAVKINYKPRLGDLGLSSQPLRMDE